MERSIAALCLALCVLCAPAAASRNLLVNETSDTQTSAHESVPWDGSPIAQYDLDMFTSPLVRKVVGITPEQVSVSYWEAPGTFLFSWVAGAAQVGVGVTPPDASQQESIVMFGTSPGKYDGQANGSALTYVQKHRYEGYPWMLDYASGVIHHVLVKDLKPGTTYYYRVGDATHWAWSNEYNFTTPNQKFPVQMTVIADCGQTPNTSRMIDNLLQISPKDDMLLYIGDLTYADNTDSNGTLACWLAEYFDALAKFGTPQPHQYCWNLPPEKIETQDTFQPKWDTWGRLFEPVFTSRAVMFVAGNHETEIQSDGTLFASYNARHPVPQDPSVINTTPNSFFSQLADNNLYSAAVIPNVATIIMLTSYVSNQDFGGPTDKQFGWFKQQLQNFNRSSTPWLIVNWHHPWYTTDPNSYKANDCMRQAYEPLFMEYGVDISFGGHVHAYERSYPVYNFTRNDCGTVHIVVGDGGNNEGLSSFPDGWIDQAWNVTSYCLNPPARQFPDYQPQRCWFYEPDTPANKASPMGYCPTMQPDWEAYRELSFGSGRLTLKDANTAVWEWWRNQDSTAQVTDRATITRTPDKCRNGAK